MANTSILAAFERMWQHVLIALSNKSDTNHTHAEATKTSAGMMSAKDKTQLSNGGIPIVTTAGTGSAYTATVDGVTSLTKGMKITIIPHTTSTSTTVTLNVNGLGAKTIVCMLYTGGTGTYLEGQIQNWIMSGCPITVEYGNNIWKIIDFHIVGASTLYGKVPITGGGTNATTAEEARTNLGAAAAKIGVVTVTSSTTLALSHAEKTIRVNSSSARTITIPTNTAVAFPTGTSIIITKVGTGTVTISPASGVTLNSKDSKRSIDGRYAAVTLYKSDANTWEMWGALA